MELLFFCVALKKRMNTLEHLEKSLIFIWSKNCTGN